MNKKLISLVVLLGVVGVVAYIGSKSLDVLESFDLEMDPWESGIEEY